MRAGVDVRVNGTKIAFKARKMNVTSQIRHFRRDDTFKVGVKLYTRDFHKNTPPAPGLRGFAVSLSRIYTKNLCKNLANPYFST